MNYFKSFEFRIKNTSICICASCQFSASYVFPFLTYGQAWDRQTDRQTDNGHRHTTKRLKLLI